jgi:hypothetical protein
MKTEHVKIEIRKVVKKQNDDDPPPKWLKGLYFGALAIQIVIAIFSSVEFFKNII